jgi:antitoxin YefM
LREAVEEVVEDHVPLRVKRRGGQDFVVVSAEDWEREQETLYVLQNRSLMEQIERSLKTHGEGVGRSSHRPRAARIADSTSTREPSRSRCGWRSPS